MSKVTNTPRAPLRARRAVSPPVAIGIDHGVSAINRSEAQIPAAMHDLGSMLSGLESELDALRDSLAPVLLPDGNNLKADAGGVLEDSDEAPLVRDLAHLKRRVGSCMSAVLSLRARLAL